MRVHKVADMDIIADTGAVRCVVIGPEDGQRRALALDCFEHDRDEMGLGLMELADLGLGIGPRHIEVAENHVTQSVGRLEIPQHILDGTL